MSPKQVVGLTLVFNSEVDQLMRKLIVGNLFKNELDKVAATQFCASVGIFAATFGVVVILLVVPSQGGMPPFKRNSA